MFGMSGTELAIILVVALLLLGPSKLPELARGVGKAVRDFKRATNDIRGTVESEFYRMDQPPESKPPGPVSGLPDPYAPVTNDPHESMPAEPPAPVAAAHEPPAPTTPKPTDPEAKG